MPSLAGRVTQSSATSWLITHSKESNDECGVTSLADITHRFVKQRRQQDVGAVYTDGVFA